MYGILLWQRKWINIVAQGKKSFIEMLKSGGLLTDVPRNSLTRLNTDHTPSTLLGVIQGLLAPSTVLRHLPLIKDGL